MDPASVAAATVAALLASPEFSLLINTSVEAKLAARGSTTPALPTATTPPRHQGKNASAQGGNVAPPSGGTGAPSGDSILERRIFFFRSSLDDTPTFFFSPSLWFHFTC